MTNRGKAPTTATFLICLVLYLIALLAQFGVVRFGPAVGQWAWIIGFGLLLLAVRVRGL